MYLTLCQAKVKPVKNNFDNNYFAKHIYLFLLLFAINTRRQPIEISFLCSYSNKKVTHQGGVRNKSVDQCVGGVSPLSCEGCGHSDQQLCRVPDDELLDVLRRRRRHLGHRRRHWFDVGAVLRRRRLDPGDGGRRGRSRLLAVAEGAGGGRLHLITEASGPESIECNSPQQIEMHTQRVGGWVGATETHAHTQILIPGAKSRSQRETPFISARFSSLCMCV